MHELPCCGPHCKYVCYPMTPTFLLSGQCRGGGQPVTASLPQQTAATQPNENSSPARTHLTSSRYCLKRSPSWNSNKGLERFMHTLATCSRGSSCHVMLRRIILGASACSHWLPEHGSSKQCTGHMQTVNMAQMSEEATNAVRKRQGQQLLRMCQECSRAGQNGALRPSEASQKSAL